MRGGKRPRSGRPKGSPNKATAERQAAIAASGRTPMEIMLANARWAHAQATQLTEKLAQAEPSLETVELFRKMIRFRELAVAWAHMAAPYVHSRLAAVAHRYTNPDGSPVGPRVNVIIHGAAPETPRFAETVPSISDKRH
jgi:hypothetical protein